MKHICLLVISILSFQGAFSAKIDKAFKALETYNYFDAKNLFYDCLSKEPIAAPYGLSVIYGRNRNPFQNLDSAYHYIGRAEENYKQSNLGRRAKEKLSEWKADSASIQKWKDSIDYYVFRRVLLKAEIQKFQAYIDKHTDSDWIPSAVFKRDSIAFFMAEQSDSSLAFEQFIEQYPQTSFLQEAMDLLIKRRFYEAVRQNTVYAYSAFLENNAASKFQEQAEDSLYSLATKDKGISHFYDFIYRYPKNRNVENAWRMIYTLYTSDGDPEKIIEFRLEYPDYPYIYELVKEFKLAVATYYPYQKNGKWGYVDDHGMLRIDTMYNYVAPFYKGVAVAIKDDKVGYINKRNEVLLPFEYDDGEDYLKSLVVVARGDYFGIVNKGNQEVLPFEYDEIGSLKEDLVLVAKNRRFGYVDLTGKLVIPMRYTLAYDFKGDYALVQDSGKFGVINTKGEVHIPFLYDWLDYFNGKSYCRAKKDGYFGLIDSDGNVLLPFEYSHIGETKDSLIMVAKNGKYGYATTYGKVSIEPQYDFSPEALIWGAFKKGYAKFKRNGRYGILNASGEELIPAIFEDIDEYSEKEWIAVKKRGKWGYSDQQLKLMIPYRYEVAKTFQYGYGIVKDKKRWKIINKQEQSMTDSVYTDLSLITKDRFLAKTEKGWGVINSQEEVLLPFQYTLVNEYSDDYLQLIRKQGMQYINRRNGRFLIQDARLQ